MQESDLFGGYTTYTTGEELAATDTSMAEAAYTPSSSFCIRTGLWAIRQTIRLEC